MDFLFQNVSVIAALAGLLALLEPGAGILAAALFAAALLGSWPLFALGAGIGAIAFSLGAFAFGLSSRKDYNPQAAAGDALHDRTLSRIARFGSFGAGFVTFFVPAGRFTATALLGAVTPRPAQSGAGLAAAALFCTFLFTAALVPVFEYAAHTFSSLIRMRMLLPGLTLAALVAAVTLRTAAARLYQKFTETNHANSGR